MYQIFCHEEVSLSQHNTYKFFFNMIVFAFMVLHASGANDSAVTEKLPAISISDTAGFMMTRVNSSKWYGNEQSPQLYNNVVMDFTFRSRINKHFSIFGSIEGYLWFNTHPLIQGTFGQLQPALGENTVSLIQAQSIYYLDNENFFGVPDDVFTAEIGLGVFPYKYNPDVRNLGENLFRSGTYPGWLRSDFDKTASVLTGLRVSSTAFGIWKNDLLVTTEMQMYPLYDISYSWLSSIKLGKVLEIGSGIDLARFTPANDSLTTRRKDIFGETVPFYLKNGVYVPDPQTPGKIDTVGGDTAYYTFTGIKLMGRMSIDLKGLLPDRVASVFGENDAKIYGEVNILGLENQGDYYDKLWQRIPVTFGLNVPAFKFLDVLSCEFEYYRMPYPDNYRNQIQVMRQTYGGTPIPDNQIDYFNGYSNNPKDSSMSYNWDKYDKDSWKWSVYIKKSFGPNFALVGQAARDHLRTMSNSLTARDYDEILTLDSHWYFALKAMSAF